MAGNKKSGKQATLMQKPLSLLDGGAESRKAISE
jgi:hypothetical protein